MPARAIWRAVLARDLLFFGIFIAAKILLHLTAITEYGYFRDELYYMACSENLAFGYVDQPPLSILLLRIARTLFGDSLLAIRLLPMLAGAAVVLLTMLIARELGGGRLAQGLAAVAVLVAPINLGVDHFFSMNSFDILFWVLAAYLVILLLKENRTRDWVALGCCLGLGLLNKISMLWFGAALAAGLLLVPQRRLLATRGPWLAAGCAMLLFLPHLIWQIANGWPTLEFMHNATTRKMVAVGPVDFFARQILVHQPLNLLIWLPGLLALLLARRFQPFRLLGWMYVIVAVILLVNGTSRPNYLSPAYPMLFAAGAVLHESWLSRERWRWLRVPAFALLLLGGAATLPLALPVLPVETFIRYEAALGVRPPSAERDAPGALPQHYADMHGWPEMAETVAQVYQSLPAEQQQKATIFAQNYGQAGAIDFFGARYGLPKAISGHNNYWLWGPERSGGDGSVIIVIGGDEAEMRTQFASVERAATIQHPYARRFESNLPVYVCRGLQIDIAEAWPMLKRFI